LLCVFDEINWRDFMRFTDFVDAVYASGWRDTCDAQHSGLRELWVKLFPVVAELEQELRDKLDT
jgi:hypothetical protein